MKPMHIDAHQHFWRYAAADYSWISEAMPGLRQDFLPEHLTPCLKGTSIRHSIAVQARQSETETRWLLDLAAHHKTICGVVGWVDLCAPDLEARLESYNGLSALIGFRHVLQDEPDDRFMLRPDFLHGVQRIASAGYAYDILVHARQLPTVIEFIDALPSMPLVIDHVAKPMIRDNAWQPWAGNLRILAAAPHVYCKLSGLVTEAVWSGWQAETLHRYMDHALTVFGPQRVMFGSDWPVCTLAASYGQVYETARDFIRATAPQHEDDIFGGNAARFYGVANSG